MFLIMTKEQIATRLALYLDCEAKILAGQSYRIGDRELTRADLATVQQKIDDLSAELKSLETKFGRRKQVVFI